MRSAEELRYLILAAQREGNRILTAALSEVGVTPAQAEALRIIDDHGPLSITDLGAMLVCDSGTNPSRIVDRLVHARLVHRSPNPHDRRLAQLATTTDGHTTAIHVAELENHLYDTLDQTHQSPDIATLLSALRAITRDSPAGQALDRRIARDSDRWIH